MKAKRTLMCLAVLSSIHAPQTFAQNSEESLSLEEVVVTARKREESMQDIPIAVSSLSGDELDTQGLSSLQDFIQGSIPSLRIAPFPTNPTTLTISMRGIGQSDPGQITRESGVGIYIDGVYLGRAQGLGSELADIERVEVLRGPQGTLYGRNAVGGAVSFTTKAPTGEFGLQQTVGVGSESQRKILTRLNLPQMGIIKAKIDYLQNEADGWVKNVDPTQSDYNAYDKQGFRIALEGDVSERFVLKYAYDQSDLETTQNYYQIYEDRFFFNGGNSERERQTRTRFGLAMEPTETDQSGHMLVAEWEATDNLVVKSITSYRELEEDTFSNYGGVFSAGLITEASMEQTQWSQEIQFIGSAMNNSVNYVAGIYLYEEEVEEYTDSFGFLLPDPTSALESFGIPHLGSSNFVLAENYFALIGRPDVKLVPAPFINVFLNYFGGQPIDLGLSSRRIVKADSESAAAFGQVTWTPEAMDQRLHLTFGIRYTEDKKTGIRPLADGKPSSEGFDLKTDSIDPAFTIAYDYSDNTNVYFRFATAYKAAGANMRSSTFGTYDPEELENYEIGLKTTLFDNRVQFNTAAFFSNYTDRQIDFANPVDVTISETINARNEIEISGFEFDLKALITRGLTLSASYVYLDSDNPDQPDVLFNNGDLARFELPQTPRHAGAVSLDYVFPAFSFGELRAHVDVVSASKSYYAPKNFEAGPSDYTMVNGRLSLSDVSLGKYGTLEASVWGRNLTDVEYVPYGANDTAMVFNAPRMTGVEVTYRY